VAIAGRTLLEKRAMSSEKPDQIQASVAAALSRLRGDLGPTGATAPKIDEPPMGGATGISTPSKFEGLNVVMSARTYFPTARGAGRPLVIRA